MNIENLMLEITRNCPLCCEHCCRGEKEIVNMELNTLENIFQDIKSVDSILLTGGDPFIAINQLEKLVEILKTKNIKIRLLRIIVNAVALSSRTLKVLKELQSLTDLDIKVSDDIFHLLELERLGLKEMRDKNYEILKDLFGAKLYGSEESKVAVSYAKMPNHYQGLYTMGYALELTDERLAAINKLVGLPYIVTDCCNPTHPQTFICENNLHGCLYFDVYGNLIKSNILTYSKEDLEATSKKLNINDSNLLECVTKFAEALEKENDTFMAKLLCKNSH